MIINDPSGIPVKVTSDQRLQAVSVVQTDINALGTLGKAWTLPFTVAAADTTDNVVFHFKNTSDDEMEFMRFWVSASGAGLWTMEYDRLYSSGGTTIALRQLNVSSGKTQSMTAYYGADITLTGTAVDLGYLRVAADTPTEILDYGPIIIPPSAMFALKFKADAGTPTIACMPILHGSNPWE